MPPRGHAAAATWTDVPMLTWAAQRTLWKSATVAILRPSVMPPGPADVRQDQVDGLLAQPLLELPAVPRSRRQRPASPAPPRARRIFDVLGRERVFEPPDAQALKLPPDGEGGVAGVGAVGVHQHVGAVGDGLDERRDGRQVFVKAPARSTSSSRCSRRQ